MKFVQGVMIDFNKRWNFDILLTGVHCFEQGGGAEVLNMCSYEVFSGNVSGPQMVYFARRRGVAEINLLAIHNPSSHER